MPPITAAGLMLGGFALCCGSAPAGVRQSADARWRKRTVQAISLVLVFFGLVQLVALATGHEASVRWIRGSTATSGSLAPLGALDFVLFGMGLGLAASRAFGGLPEVLGLALYLTACLGLCRYLFGVSPLPTETTMGAAGAAAFAALGLGLVAHRAEYAVTPGPIFGEPGIRSLRFYLPAVLVAPFAAAVLLMAAGGVATRGFASGIVELAAVCAAVSFCFLWLLAARHERHAHAQARLVAIVNSSDDAIIGKTLAGIITDWNAGAEKIFGYTAPEAVGRSITMLLPPERVDEEPAIIARIVRGEHVAHFETERVHKDGRRVSVSVTISPLLDATGQIVGASKIARDITGEKRAEHDLRESQQRFAVMFNRSPLPAILSRFPSFIIVDANDTWLHLFGLTKKEIIGRTSAELGFHRDPVQREKLIAEINANHSLRDREVSLRNPAGVDLILSINVEVLSIEGEEFVLTTALDLTARKKAEAELRLSESLVRDAGRMAHVGGWHFIPQTGAGYWTEEVARIHDLPPDAPASVSRGLSHYVGESRTRIEAAVKAAVERAEPYDLELEFESAAGRRKWIRTIGEPVVEGGKVVLVRGAFQDITAYKNLEMQFLRAQRMEAVGTLAGGIAHDLNNILAPMLIVAPTLREKLGDPHDLAMIDMIEQATLRGANIIRQLLTFSRGIEGERGPVQLKHLVREMVAIMQETFPREIAIASSVAAQLWPVIADATQLHQVLMNLCVNARDAMPAGGKLAVAAQNAIVEKGEIAQHPEARAGSYVLVTVTDTGQGIPPENLARIFEPFFTTKAVGKGTGLGLSTVLGIVKSHGGFVTVYSEGGRGTVFKIYLPADLTSAEVAVTTPPPAPRGRQELILVVDDEPAIRLSLERMLRAHNYRVLGASNGDEAVRLFVQHGDGIKLLFTDLMMPGMTGMSLIRALRRLEPRLRVVAASGLQDRERQEELQALGIHEVLFKPFTPLAVLEAINLQLRSQAPTGSE
ncbi:MAG TPA: PAS domain S-box protein [Candidatus Didemnitutus sp.]